MKVLFCIDCGDIVVPRRQAFVFRACMCGRHLIWYSEPGQNRPARKMTVVDHRGTNDGAFILRLQVGFVEARGDSTSGEIAGLVQRAGGRFRDQGSLIVRSDIAQSTDVAWAPSSPPDLSS